MKLKNRIDKIAKKGKDSYLEYYSLVDEMVSNSKYDLLKQMLLLDYDIFGEDLSVNDFRKMSWPKILLLTNTNLQESKKSLQDSFNIYQVGIWYHKNDNTKLGWVKESVIGDRTSLICFKESSIFGEMVFQDWDYGLAFNDNVINLYRLVILYLLED